jgi:hypothetical protein
VSESRKTLERTTYDCPICGRRHHRIYSKEGALHRSQELGAAWAEAEAALPEGWRLNGLTSVDYHVGPLTLGWIAHAVGPSSGAIGDAADTPAAALHALAAKLRERSA